MSLRTEIIEWHDVADGLPDDDTTVLMDWDTADPWPGWHEDGRWYSVGADPVDPPQRWAHMPAGVGP